MSATSVDSINPSGVIPLTGVKKRWGELTREEKVEEFFDIGFKSLVIPSVFVSIFSSIYSFISSNFFGKDDDFIDKTANISNRLAYFFNGLYGSTGSFRNNDLPGGLGYFFVALSAIAGTKETIYFLKGPGSAFDQTPSMNVDVAHNPAIINKYDTQGNVKSFNTYSTIWDSLRKTKDAVRVIYKDIFNDYKANRAGGKNVVKALLDVLLSEFVKGKKTAEKNLLVSSTGILSGVFIGLLSRMKGLGFTIGSSIRDIFGIHADLSLVKKGGSQSKEGERTGIGNLKYMICGIFYTLGSVCDLIFRWTGFNKLETATIGFDNAGFLFMTLANASDYKEIRSNATGNGKVNGIETDASGNNPAGDSQSNPININPTRPPSAASQAATP